MPTLTPTQTANRNYLRHAMTKLLTFCAKHPEYEMKWWTPKGIIHHEDSTRPYYMEYLDSVFSPVGPTGALTLDCKWYNPDSEADYYLPLQECDAYIIGFINHDDIAVSVTGLELLHDTLPEPEFRKQVRNNVHIALKCFKQFRTDIKRLYEQHAMATLRKEICAGLSIPVDRL